MRPVPAEFWETPLGTLGQIFRPHPSRPPASHLRPDPRPSLRPPTSRPPDEEGELRDGQRGRSYACVFTFSARLALPQFRNLSACGSRSLVNGGTSRPHTRPGGRKIPMRPPEPEDRHTGRPAHERSQACTASCAPCRQCQRMMAVHDPTTRPCPHKATRPRC